MDKYSSLVDCLRFARTKCFCLKHSEKDFHLFKEYAQNWFDVFKKPTVRPLTAQTCAQQLEKHLYPVFGDMFIEDITPVDIQTHLNNLQHLAQESQQKQMNVLRVCRNNLSQLVITSINSE